jgi:hypothetical protein
MVIGLRCAPFGRLKFTGRDRLGEPEAEFTEMKLQTLIRPRVWTTCP